MIRILLVEDDAAKRREVSAVIQRVSGVREADVETATDVIDAKRKLEAAGYDLLLLDIHLPKRAIDFPTPAGGLEILRWLKRRGKQHRPTYIIGTTQYETSLELAKSEFNNLIWSMISIDLSDGTWKRKLAATVSAILDQTVPPYSSDGSTFKTHLAILTALDAPELAAILDLPLKWKRISVRFDEASYFEGEYYLGGKQLRVVAAAAPDKGLPAAAVSATKLIHSFRPKYLVMAGICAGVRGRVKIGDLLLADPSYDWGSGKTREIIKTKKKSDARAKLRKVTGGPDFFQPAPYQMRLDNTIRSRAVAFFCDALLAEISESFQGKRPKKPSKLAVAPVASGAAVLQSDTAVARILSAHKDVKGIDMEIYSVMFAAHVAELPRPTCFALKAVCDFGDHKKSDGYQKYAAYVSAHALHRFLQVL